jgi:hypothetical protein
MKLLIRLILPAVFFIAVGCISWDEGWKIRVQATGQGNVAELLASASAMEASADSAEKIKNLIASYEKIAAIDPGSYEVLSRLGEFTHLYAYIYSTDKKTKEEYYLKSLHYCERAMYTNPKFKELADQGKPVWESVSALTPKEMDAMFYWYVAIGQYWTECYNSVSHLLNFYWPARANKVLERMSALQPDWKYGRVHMAWGAFYAIVPGFLGGDVKKSAEEFTKAIKVGPDALVNFYVRARNLHVKNGDREAFKKDLEFIISRDLKKIDYEYPWAAGYQMKAKELLGQIDKLF